MTNNQGAKMLNPGKSKVLAEVKEQYGEWADNYDRDVGLWKCNTHTKIANRLRPHLKKGMKLVDLACGTGLNGLQYRDLYLRLTGVDYSREMLEKAKEKKCYCRLVHADISKTSFRTNRFDAAICSDALTYFPDKQPFIREMSRIVKPGGMIALLMGCTENGLYKISKKELASLLSEQSIIPTEMCRILMHYEESVKPIYGWLTIGQNSR